VIVAPVLGLGGLEPTSSVTLNFANCYYHSWLFKIIAQSKKELNYKILLLFQVQQEFPLYFLQVPSFS